MLSPVDVARLAQAAKEGATKAASGVRVMSAFGARVLDRIAASGQGGEVTLSSLGNHTKTFIEPTAAYVPDDPFTIGLWHLDDSAADASANENDLTLYNTSYGTGKFANGLVLNGTTAYADATLVSSEPIRDTLYVAAWVKPTSDGTIIDWPGIAKLYIDSNVLKADFGGETFVGPAVTLSSWQLCHAQFDSGVVWVGVDDIAARDEATFQQFTGEDMDVEIGTDLAATVDEIMLATSRILVDDLALRPAFPGPGQIGYWRFNDGSGSYAKPVGMVGGPVIALVNNAWGDGYWGGAAVFDGTAYGTLPLSASTAARFGIEIMVKFNTVAACAFVDQEDGINFAFTGTAIRAALTGVTNPNSDIAPFVPEADTWYSIAVTYDGTNKMAWLNGQKIGEVAASGTVTISDNDVHIAETYAGASRLDGSVDSLIIGKFLVRPYRRPAMRFLAGQYGFEADEDWMLM